MPTRNVNLTPELDRFIASKVDTGLYANASEVMRTALRLLERDEREHEAKMMALRAAMGEGIASGAAMPGTFAKVRGANGSVKPESIRLLSESLKILKERGSTITLDSEFGSDLEAVIDSHREPLNPPAWD